MQTRRNLAARVERLERGSAVLVARVLTSRLREIKAQRLAICADPRIGVDEKVAVDGKLHAARLAVIADVTRALG